MISLEVNANNYMIPMHKMEIGGEFGPCTKCLKRRFINFAFFDQKNKIKFAFKTDGNQ